MAKKKTSKSPATFESSLENLKSIVGELEQGNLSLDESLAKYESGIKLLGNCYKALKKAEKKIGVLVEMDDAGRIKTTPFDDAATHQDASISTANDASDSDEDDEDVDDPNVLF